MALEARRRGYKTSCSMSLKAKVSIQAVKTKAIIRLQGCREGVCIRGSSQALLNDGKDELKRCKTTENRLISKEGVGCCFFSWSNLQLNCHKPHFFQRQQDNNNEFFQSLENFELDINFQYDFLLISVQRINLCTKGIGADEG